jgi:hypothetical protein
MFGFLRMIVFVILSALVYGTFTGIYNGLPAQRIAEAATAVSDSEGPPVMVAPKSKLAQIGEKLGLPTYQRAADLTDSTISIPSSDVDAACRRIMQGHDRETHICVADEQAAYDWLKWAWPQVSDRVKRQAIASMRQYEGNWFAGYYRGLERSVVQFYDMDVLTHPSEMPFRR